MLAGCGFQNGVAPGDGRTSITIDGSTAPPADAPLDASIDAHVTPIVFVQDGMGAMTASGFLVVVAPLSEPQLAGDLNIVVVSIGGAATATITDASMNTYVSMGSVELDGISQKMFYAANIAPANANIVTLGLSQSVGSATMRVLEYSGIATTNPLDNATSGAGVGDATDSGLTTTTHAHDLILGADTSNAVATGPGTGFISRMVYLGDEVEDRTVAATGSYNATLPLDASTDWIMTVAAFKGAD